MVKDLCHISGKWLAKNTTYLLQSEVCSQKFSDSLSEFLLLKFCSGEMSTNSRRGVTNGIVKAVDHGSGICIINLRSKTHSKRKTSSTPETLEVNHLEQQLFKLSVVENKHRKSGIFKDWLDFQDLTSNGSSKSINLDFHNNSQQML